MVKFVEVKWRDSKGISGWKEDSEIKSLEPSNIVSYGWLLYKDEKKIILAASKADDGDYASIDIIPFDWVQKIKVIK